ncbi:MULTISPECIES: diguanylate cyclase [unclassified Pseudomonas]|uniref:GGDEF domain-containing protein n=1 Tax=unclassified Pseudomonas TaxID=196821 RepID=UPI00131A7E8D|nr:MULTISPECIES: GGDEF domain-containing protein [unclassified Pseudomonas]
MSGRFLLTAHLNRLINALLVVTSLATACGMALLVQQAHENSTSMDLTRDQLPVYEEALGLVQAISAERGPTNALLGGRGGDSHELARARVLSDQRFARLQVLLQDCRQCSVTAEQAANGYQTLLQARARVDQRLRGTPDDPASQDIASVVQGMFRALDSNFITADLTLHDLIQRSPAVAIYLVNAKLAARLRDTAGRLGSLLTPALQAQRLPSGAEQVQLLHTQGRINQLMDLLRSNLNLAPSRPEHDRFVQVQERYLGEGLDWYHQTLAALATGTAPTAASFAQGYVPTMVSILELRDEMLSLAHDEADALAREAQLRLWLTIAAAVGILLALGTGLLLLKQRLLTPLLANTQRLLSLSRRARPLGTVAEDDPRSLFAAFAQLEDELLQADRLREERDALIAELGVRAETDYLTGLANRRAFERELAQGVTRTAGQLAAIAFDIDHFKRINDTYGHAAGDLLLQQLAQRCRELLRPGDRIARIGGEEFAVLADVAQPTDALALAERLRCGIAEVPFAVGPTEALPVTASFGVAVTPRLAEGVPVRLLAQADAALYRAKHRGRNCSEIAEPG